MNRRIVITVDGLAGSGKTSLSRALADKISFAHFSSGALYRALAWLALQQGVDLEDPPALARISTKHCLEMRSAAGGAVQVFIDGHDLTHELYTPQVSEATSITSKHPEVRRALIESQRNAFPGRDLVAEGRDMGTVVFPDAPLKFFIEVPEKIRIERRLEQLRQTAVEQGKSAEQVSNMLKQVGIEISERDRRDQERDTSPAKPASDAVIIENFGRKLTEVVENMYDLAAKKGLLKR